LDFGIRIKGLREAKSWSQTDLVMASGLSAPTISRYEGTGDAPAVNWKNMQKLADALDVDERYLEGRRPDLDALSFDLVAAEESLRRFLEASTVQRKDAIKYARLAKESIAPKTVQAWKDFVRLLRLFLGKDVPTNTKAKDTQRYGTGKQQSVHVVRAFRRKAEAKDLTSGTLYG
jgi:transcriptional regulator with XRE-family HTH domain